MAKFLFMAVVTMLALAISTAYADEAAVRGALQQAFPQDAIKSISRTPVPGLMEAVVDDRIFYLTEDGHYLLGGPLIDTKANQNLTQEHLDRLNAIPFASLPLDRAIKRVKGDGSRKIAIFEDPDCPYCRKLEQEIRNMNNLTIYVFLYPIEQLHPGSANKSKAIWCARDRAKAWDDAMRTGTAPGGTASCDNPLKKNVAYGREHGISGTPTMILANGYRLVGAVSREKLERQLAKATEK